MIVEYDTVSNLGFQCHVYVGEFVMQRDERIENHHAAR